MLNPLMAVTDHDPYPYYAELITTKPLYYDDMLGMWVASSAAAVAAVFDNSHCRVRPAAEPVPKHLLGSPAADIFRQLVRMNDGARHCPLKHAVSATLASINAVDAIAQSNQWASVLAARYGIRETPEQFADFTFHLSVHVLGSLLGIPEDMLHQTAGWVHDFVGCLAPASGAEQIERGKHAAAELHAMFHALLHTQQLQSTNSLLARLADAAPHSGSDDTERIVANGIGVLSQAYEATAGLIGNTLLALAAHADVRSAIATHPDYLPHAIQETLRYDAPVQNTRRFLAETGVVAGQPMQAGATILLVLAAANRDSHANPAPAQFDLWRANRQHFTFGRGTHACPGEALAPIIAAAGVAQLMQTNIWSQLHAPIIYRASVNGRIPIIGGTSIP
ncbi:MAG: cytochrome P450 [Roseiflexaceae bacterium]|nr:cytochrome P450 [Roseiflexaceae bacterium]